MGANPVLADSCYYIQCLRRGEDPLKRLALVAATRDLVICPVIRCEVGRGIRHEGVLNKLHRAWDVMINVPTDPRLWREAEETLWQLDRRGIILPLTDVVIACCARRVQADVLTYDKHFDSIPNVRVITEV